MEVVNREELDLVLHQGPHHVLLGKAQKPDHVINNHVLVLGAAGDSGPLVRDPVGVVNRQEVDLAQLRHVLDQAEKSDYVIDKHVLVLGEAGDSGPLVHDPVEVVNR